MVQAIPAAIAVTGSVVKGLGANAAHRAAARAADENAVGEMNDGVARESRIRDDARLAMGRQIAAQGASGFVMGAGSARDALLESQINATLDALTARREAATAARSWRVKAKAERRAGTSALIAAGFDVANTITGMNADWAGAKAGRAGGGSALVDPGPQGRRREPGVNY